MQVLAIEGLYSYLWSVLKRALEPLKFNILK